MLSEEARKTQIMSFSRSIITPNVTFWVQSFFNFWHVLHFLFQNLNFSSVLFQNLTACKVFKQKICLFVIFSIPNKTHCNFFISISCFSKGHRKWKRRRFHGLFQIKTRFLSAMFFKWWHVSINLVQNLKRSKRFKSNFDAL